MVKLQVFAHAAMTWTFPVNHVDQSGFSNQPGKMAEVFLLTFLVNFCDSVSYNNWILQYYFPGEF